MKEAIMMTPYTVAPAIDILPAFLPVPGFGVLPVNSFVIHAVAPVLVDTGPAALRERFLSALETVIDPARLRWIWITHADPDHVGNLKAVLARAPDARLVTTFLGMAKLGLLGFPLERVRLINPGQDLHAGDRALTAVAPPVFDAPETTGLFDSASGTLFSADSFGALMPFPSRAARDLEAHQLKTGMLTWATVDAPWLQRVDRSRFRQSLQTIAELAPAAVLSSHLPPATDMTDTLLSNLADAPDAPPFIGPDQAALERMLAA